MRHHDLQMRSIELSAGALATYDCVVIATNHAAYDWQFVADHARLIVDTRGAMRHLSGERNNVVQA
jgi:UDP-N-acetyl-D-glucosamine dehydrogenase